MYENNKYYKLSLSVKDADLPGPDGEDPLAPVPEGTTRAEDIVSLLVLERNPSDGKIIMT